MRLAATTLWRLKSPIVIRKGMRGLHTWQPCVRRAAKLNGKKSEAVVHPSGGG